MMAKPLLLAAVILLSVPAASLAQSQTGGNYGVPGGSGSPASRSNGGYVHSHHRDSGDRDSGGQSARGGENGGHEIDARDADAAAPVARQASAPK